MQMQMSFPGGLAVDAKVDGFAIHTDQPVEMGGSGAAPAPFDLFLAAIGTCAGFYVLRFCQSRGIDTRELGVSLETTRDPESHRVSTVRIDVRLPPDFPEKYVPAVRRAVDQCAVKRHILQPPEFEVMARIAQPIGA